MSREIQSRWQMEIENTAWGWKPLESPHGTKTAPIKVISVANMLKDNQTSIIFRYVSTKTAVESFFRVRRGRAADFSEQAGDVNV